ncbi:MAG: 3D-(3,5/4)-trihydroxycyclohexane-1,2-dione acylhydrolase (decyclizing) [Pelagibacterales bacterium]|nr:3D-(3,5/4)-trihydroxycyclohexane-1,2-dione acylhydrolase (decyclizing) [Pelagibacterales bacterium]|tara:strand:- start:1185 stop:3032 length:1848 start_codon:yes stop_codon:yes gene_type:complete
MKTVRLTSAQALVKWIIAQKIEQFDGSYEMAFKGVWGIFGHGNVAGIGEALEKYKTVLPTYRGHNEQGMAHAALAYTKEMQRRRFMAVTSSIGPGATNLVTAAALAHVNRLPILLLPGDVFADRRPDPVLQQIEDFEDGTVSANDCFRPVSRYFDRITRPEQLLNALPKAMSILTDPAMTGPVTLAFCQDVQAEAYNYPVSFFEPSYWNVRRIQPDRREIERLASTLEKSKKPVLIAGGGVKYSNAQDELKEFLDITKVPLVVTQAGKSVLVEKDEQNLGSIGVTGSSSANAIISDADFIISVGSRLQDFTTGSNGLIKAPVYSINVQAHDLTKHQSKPILGDAKVSLQLLKALSTNYKVSSGYISKYTAAKEKWLKDLEKITAPSLMNSLPSDSQVIGAVNRSVPENTIVIGAAGSMPGELHKLWKVLDQNTYHMEYGYSCMGYEISAGIGVNLATPNRPNVVFSGDGSYLMMNSELATAAMMGISMTLILTNNKGYGCINRLQKATGGAEFNNLFSDSKFDKQIEIDFVSHAKSMGAKAVYVSEIAELEVEVKNTIRKKGVKVIVIDTDPNISTVEGGAWWDVAIPETFTDSNKSNLRKDYLVARINQNKGFK